MSLKVLVQHNCAGSRAHTTHMGLIGTWRDIHSLVGSSVSSSIETAMKPTIECQ